MTSLTTTPRFPRLERVARPALLTLMLARRRRSRPGRWCSRRANSAATRSPSPSPRWRSSACSRSSCTRRASRGSSAAPANSTSRAPSPRPARKASSSPPAPRACFTPTRPIASLSARARRNARASSACSPERRRPREAIYRLAQAARSGRTASEELRLSPPLAGEGEAAWYRIRVRPLDGPAQGQAALWTVSDITQRPRPPRDLLPGPPARHRLSRPRAGGLLLGRGGRRHRLYERDARPLARLRHRRVHAGPDEPRPTSSPPMARRCSTCRRRAGRGEDGRHGRRPQAPPRRLQAGAADPSRRRSAPTAPPPPRARWCWRPTPTRRAPRAATRRRRASRACSTRRRCRSPR